jgi:broad specificity phosphatase PhoE
MVAVWLIRHGESESNAGLSNSELTQWIRLTSRGHQQAKRIARSLPQPDLIVTSPYLRTKETAQPTIERFPKCPQAEWPVQEFDYISLPPGKISRNEYLSLCNAYWVRSDPFYVDGEGAESFASLLHRVDVMIRKLEQLAQKDHKVIVVFSHAGFIRAVLWSMLCHEVETTPASMDKFCCFLRSLRFPNGAIVKLHLQDTDVFFSKVLIDHLQTR